VHRLVVLRECCDRIDKSITLVSITLDWEHGVVRENVHNAPHHPRASAGALIGHRPGRQRHKLLREMGSAMDWRHRAICLDEDPELFFPIGNTGPAIMQIEEAKQVCRRCDVREQCLAWALEAGQDHGVWGGLSEDERRALKRRNARARIRTA
jgi:WhiB family redox-sensing transcriptional regulator